MRTVDPAERVPLGEPVYETPEIVTDDELAPDGTSIEKLQPPAPPSPPAKRARAPAKRRLRKRRSASGP